MSMNKMREQLAQSFIDCLNEGQIPWEATWHTMKPQNPTTGKTYRGINSFWLSFVAHIKGYKDPRWCTFKQAKEKDWDVKKGEKATTVEFWSLYDKKTRQTVTNREATQIINDNPEREKDIILMSRVYNVFNAEQLNGVPELDIKSNVDIDTVRKNRDVLLRNMGLGFREEGLEAYYTPSKDIVTMPHEGFFKDTYGYMSTFLHECGHATGHSSRLNRDMGGFFGSERYAKEELRAEIASAFTAQALGLSGSEAGMEHSMKNHKAYIQSWIQAIKSAPNELFAAIRDAEQISDYLLEKGEFIKDMEQDLTEEVEKPSLDSLITSAAAIAAEKQGSGLQNGRSEQEMVL